MEKRNGKHSSPGTIPRIMVTDYDADLANQQSRAHETKRTEERYHASDSPKSSPNRSVLNESEEEDREIIESLTRAHATNSERHVDVDEMIASTVVMSESTKKNDEMMVSTVLMSESTKENVMPQTLTEKKELSIDIVTDDDRADMEVSHITSYLESKNKYVSLPRSVNSLKRPTASFVAQPPGLLPNIGGVGLPRLVPRKKESSATGPPSDMLDDDLFFPIFPPLAEMSFSVERFNRSEYSPTNGANGGNGTNGTNKLKNRRATRLCGETEGDSHYSSSSSSDEHPPIYWKLYANSSSEKSDGGSKEDISEILDTFHVVEDGAAYDDVPSTSNDSRNFNSSSKTAEDENKK